MSEQFRVRDGLLRWADHQMRVGFKLEVSQHGGISIEYDEMHFSSGDDWIGQYEVLSNLQRGENRDIPFFHLSGIDEDGVRISTDFAEMRRFDQNFYKQGVSFQATGSAAEVNFYHGLTGESDTPSPTAIEYLSRAQLGFATPSIETRHGNLRAGGSPKVSDYRDRFGVIRIEKTGGDIDSEWIEACDALADRSLQLLSLSQGRWLQWTARTVFAGDILLSRTIRPHELREPSLAHLFHHQNLGPILRLVSESFTEQCAEETGLSIALSWMLSSASSLENRYLNLLVALEHLISVIDPKVEGVLRRERFRSRVRAPLLQLIEQIASDEDLANDVSEFYRRKISEMNQPTFYDKILQLIRHYQVPVADIEAELKFSLVDCRNDLVHRGLLERLGDDRKRIHRSCDVAEEFMKRVVMAVLRYKGQYISALYNLDSYHFGDGEVYPVNPRNSGSGDPPGHNIRN